jgi:hypothetical protein
MRPLILTLVLCPFAVPIRAQGPLDEKRIAALIRDLDAPAFRTRQKVEEELRKLGKAVLPRLQQALAGNTTLEQRCRLNRLITSIDPDADLRKRVRELLAVLSKALGAERGKTGDGRGPDRALSQVVDELVALDRSAAAVLKEELAQVTDPKLQRELAAVLEYLRKLHEALEK